MILAYTRAEVAALNVLAREALGAAGELGVEEVVRTEQGARAMAAGERVMFLRNERGLGAGPGGQGGVAVKNGTLGTVLAVEGLGERLTVRLDGAAPGQAGEDAGPVVTFSLREYGHVDWGYAATIHKAQGVTVDRAHVLASEHMDRHAAYVALTRHRDGVALHWSGEALGDRAGLARSLGRERAKDTSLDYGPGWAAGPEAAYDAQWGWDRVAERVALPFYAGPYAARRGVVPAAEVAAGDGPPEQRLAARTALLLNRVATLREAGDAALRQHAERVAVHQAQGEALPGLQPWFGRARARQALDTALVASVRLVEQGTASIERMATVAAGLPEALRRLAERAREATALQQAASAGVAGFRERFEAEKRRAAAERVREAQAQQDAAEAARQAARQQEAAREAAQEATRRAQEVARPRRSHGPSM